jgi:hypothetical protein
MRHPRARQSEPSPGRRIASAQALAQIMREGEQLRDGCGKKRASRLALDVLRW